MQTLEKSPNSNTEPSRRPSIAIVLLAVILALGLAIYTNWQLWGLGLADAQMLQSETNAWDDGWLGGSLLGWGVVTGLACAAAWVGSELLARLRVKALLDADVAHPDCRAAARNAESALRESERRYHTLAKLSPVGLFHANAEGHCLYVNERWCEISGITPEEALGEGWLEAIHPDDRERVLLQWLLATKENLPFQSEYRFQTPSGVVSWVFGQAHADAEPSGKVIGYVGTIADITGRKQALERMRQNAFYDQLTNLPNQTYFLERLGHLQSKASQHQVYKKLAGA